jgi:hypothetical protein
MSVTVVANLACVPIRRSLLLASLLALFQKLKSLLPESQLSVSQLSVSPLAVSQQQELLQQGRQLLVTQ